MFAVIKRKYFRFSMHHPEIYADLGRNLHHPISYYKERLGYSCIQVRSNFITLCATVVLLQVLYNTH